MKTTLLLLVALLLGLGAFQLGRLTIQGSATTEQKELFTCGMHPQVIQEGPGNCPICGMKLTPVRRQPGAPGVDSSSAAAQGTIRYYKSTMIPGETSPGPAKDSMGMEMVPVYEGQAAMDAAITIDPVTIQNMGVRTAVITNGPLRRVVRTVATIDYEEPALAEVTTKFGGWIEKLYVDAVGAQVHRGDPLFEIYSPELYSAQTEYLLAMRDRPADGGTDVLREAARTKLRYLDISEAQIAELDKTRQPQKTLKILAPADGFVIEKKVVEGQMVSEGMALYRIADLGLVWVLAQVYEQDLPYLRLGQEAVVSLSYLPDRKFRGRVTYIYPTVDPRTRTVQVRMEFHNPGYYLKPGMFASVELVAEIAPSALLVPDMAVLRSGDRNTVFVALDGGRFAARRVTLGARAEDGLLQVLDGLSSGERVVTSGQFMLDSESQLREAIQKMMEPGSAAMAKHAMPGKEPTSQTPGRPPTSAEAAADTSYLCPMPEHVAIEYDHPGKCPICGMTLVPVSTDTLKRIHPGGRVEYFTCPMPEHSDVHQEHSGKCPRCRMTLIPVMSEPEAPTPPPAAAATLSNAELPTLYTCPMASHADVVSDHPGKCPKCEMDLVETSKVAHGKVSEDHWRSEHPGPGPR